MSIPPLISTRPRTAFDRISLYFQPIHSIRSDTKLFVRQIPFSSNLINRSIYSYLIVYPSFLFSFFFRKMPKNSTLCPFLYKTPRDSIVQNLFHFEHKDGVLLANFKQFFFDHRMKWQPIYRAGPILLDRQRFRRLIPQREDDRR